MTRVKHSTIHLFLAPATAGAAVLLVAGRTGNFRQSALALESVRN